MTIGKRILAATAAMLLATGLAANGLNLNGVGSKAIAMGGAFIGLADDYSAVFWNPAGLTQIKSPTLFLFETNLIPTGTYQLPLYGIDAQTKASVYPSGSLGFIKPLNDKVVVGLAVYVPSGTGAKWDGADLALLASGQNLKWESMMAIATICPVIAVQVNDVVSLGASFNVNYGILNLKRPGYGQYTEKLHGTALGATFSAMVRPDDRFSFGATVRIPSKVTFKGTGEMAGAPLVGLSGESDAERSTTWPLWLGMGVAVKPVDKLTLTLDAQYTNWSKIQTIGITYNDPAWQAIKSTAGHPLNKAFDNDFDLNWTSQWQMRVGAEYAISDRFALRAGFYSDPSPSPADTLNVLLPEISYKVVTAGFGYRSGRLSIDACFEYLDGKDYVSPLTGKMPGTHGMKILVPNIAFTYRLK